MPPKPKIENHSERVWDHDTNVQGLVRNRDSGRYYARFKVRGKRTMKALKTKTWSVAKLRLADELAKVARQRVQKKKAPDAEDVRVGDLLDRLSECYVSETLAANTKESHRVTMAILTGQWAVHFKSDLRTLKPEKITSDVVVEFSRFLATKAVQKVRNNGAKSKRRGYGAVTINKVVGALHRALRIGVENKLISELPFEISPADGPSIKQAIKQRHLQLPTKEQMRRLFASMREAGERMPSQAEGHDELLAYVLRRADQSANLAEFMAYSGARIGEAISWVWEDDLGDFIYLRGTKTESSMNRRVPKIPAMRDLLDRMRARLTAEGGQAKGRAFTVRECRAALESACLRIGVPRLTHHMLRHVFATICIESGVDIPTVSRWLGHSDGGALAMRTYGHLRMEHSVAAAQKVLV